MSGAAPPSGPRFRIVSGRGLGERVNATTAAASPQPPPALRPNAPPSAPSPQPLSIQSLEQRPLQDERTSNSSSPASIPSIMHQQVGQLLSSQMGPGSPIEAGGSQQLQDEHMIQKCIRFFKTLITLSKNPEHHIEAGSAEATTTKVKHLTLAVISGSLPVEDFTRALQSCLRSQAQPHLLPFLQTTLPKLRQAIRNGEVQLDGIQLPPDMKFHEDNPQSEEVSPQHIPVAPISNMMPMSMPIPTTALQQSLADMEMEEPREEDAIHVRALQESALNSALIRPEDIMKKITEKMKEACYVEEDVLTLISDAAEYRLREILAELAVLAEHRMDNLRMSMTYAPIDDVKGQIRFLENLDRQQFEQNENREKEALIRMSKGKGMAKETIEKAKEMQRIDAEAKRNRDANAAAIAALSSKSAKPRWEAGTASGSGMGYTMRPKTIRVNIRDFQVLANNDPLCARTNIIHKLALGGGVQSESL